MRVCTVIALACSLLVGPHTAAQEETKRAGTTAPKPEDKKARWNLWEKLRKPVRTNRSQVSGVESRPGSPERQRDENGEMEEYTGGEWFVVPIPIVDPTIRTGLAGAGGYIYRLNPADDVSPESITGAAGFGTSNGTWGVVAGHQMAWGEDRWRMNAAGGYAGLNFNFGGRGADPDDEKFDIPLNVKGSMVTGEILRRVVERWFVGLRYSLLFSDTGPRLGQEPELPPDFPDLSLAVTTSALGSRVLRDTRDSQFYPRKGTLTDFKVDIFRGGIGSDFDYEKYQFGFNLYRGFKKRHVVAGRAAACGVNGGAPFFDLCYLGQAQDLRGYRMGRFQDEALLATQAEYRLELPWRFGLVGFVGVGQVAPGFDKFKKGNWLPGGGFGIRFKVAKRNHLNLRLDFAWGRNSSAIYISGGETF